MYSVVGAVAVLVVATVVGNVGVVVVIATVVVVAGVSVVGSCITTYTEYC